MSRMKSPETTRLVARVSEHLKEDFKEACDACDVSMTEAVEEFMREFTDQHAPMSVNAPEGGYYPDDRALREIYEVCLDVAENGAYGPMVYQRRHASAIAQETRRVTKADLKDALIPLRQQGYVAQGPIPPTLQGEAAKRWRSWIIKPPCADPERWKYRE